MKYLLLASGLMAAGASLAATSVATPALVQKHNSCELTDLHIDLDYDTAAVLTFIRNSFGNKAEPILPWQVNKLRTEIKGKQGFYTPAELLEEHPHSN